MASNYFRPVLFEFTFIFVGGWKRVHLAVTFVHESMGCLSNTYIYMYIVPYIIID